MDYGHNSQKRLIGKNQREEERYLYLINKFFEGATLWERTEIEQKGGLVERCMGECSSQFFEDYFCTASMHSDIQCPYAGKRVDGGNPFQICTYFSSLSSQYPQGVINPELFINVRKS